MEKRQQLHRMESRILELRKIKDEKESIISSKREGPGDVGQHRKDKDIDYSLELPAFQK
jgi:hypothetical protein